ncbi:unnamed protein product, partial [Choristocarpus tenellus]
FTIDGEFKENTNVYSDKVLYIQGDRKPRLLEVGSNQYLSALDGLIVRSMQIKNAGGECMRMRYFVTYAEIYDNTIQDCGIQDYRVEPDSGGKNGEGLYIGTSYSQWDNGINYTDEPDESNWNWVHHNHLNTMVN